MNPTLSELRRPPPSPGSALIRKNLPLRQRLPALRLKLRGLARDRAIMHNRTQRETRSPQIRPPHNPQPLRRHQLHNPKIPRPPIHLQKPPTSQPALPRNRHGPPRPGPNRRRASRHDPKPRHELQDLQIPLADPIAPRSTRHTTQNDPDRANAPLNTSAVSEIRHASPQNTPIPTIPILLP